jgi:hypothetical protein
MVQKEKGFGRHVIGDAENVNLGVNRRSRGHWGQTYNLHLIRPISPLKILLMGFINSILRGVYWNECLIN